MTRKKKDEIESSTTYQILYAIENFNRQSTDFHEHSHKMISDNDKYSNLIKNKSFEVASHY